LREFTFNDDQAEYNHQAAACEIVLRRLFPDIHWRVARYEALVQQRTIRPYIRPPDWLLIEATTMNGDASQSIKLERCFFEHVSSPAALLSIVGDRLKREIA